jgi:hypothetical protein
MVTSLGEIRSYKPEHNPQFTLKDAFQPVNLKNTRQTTIHIRTLKIEHLICTSLLQSI